MKINLNVCVIVVCVMFLSAFMYSCKNDKGAYAYDNMEDDAEPPISAQEDIFDDMKIDSTKTIQQAYVSEDRLLITQKIRVEGGHIYQSSFNRRNACDVEMIFVPDK